MFWTPRSPSGPPAPLSIVSLRVATELLPHPLREHTRDYPLTTGSVLHRSGCEPLLRSLLESDQPIPNSPIPNSPSQHSRCRWHEAGGQTSQGNSRDLHCIDRSDLRPPSGWYRASSFVALSPRWDRLYPKAVRRTPVLRTASFRFHLAMDTLAVRLSRSHHQVLQPTCTAKCTQ